MTKIIFIILFTAVACNEGTTTQPTNNNNNNEICNDNIDNDFDGDIDCNDSDCRFNGACTVETCGNGSVEGTEECDGADFDGKSCITEGYTAGQLSCTAGCVLDVEACENPDPLKIMQSGQRIKMRIGRSSAPDGSVSFNGWYDTTLGINCAWRKHSNDSLPSVFRCLPEIECKLVYYASPDCSSPVCVIDNGETSISSGTKLSAQINSGSFRAYTIGSEWTGSTYIKRGGVCTSANLYDWTSAHSLAEVAASNFQDQAEE